MDPNEEQEEHQDKGGLALGIDFGNSKISAAVWDINKKIPSMVIDPETKKYQFPATIYFSGVKKSAEENQDAEDNADYEIGVDFKDSYNLDNYIYDIKKLIGQKLSSNQNDQSNQNIRDKEIQEIYTNMKYKTNINENNEIELVLGGTPKSFDKIASLFIEKIKQQAENQFKNKTISCCSISVPHGFNNSQRSAIKHAARRAGIETVYIITDPLSTAIYYASKNKIHKTEYFLIIDFGSSKLDVSIVSINKKNSIQILNSGGDSHLGGNALNNELLREVYEIYKQEGGSSNLDNSQQILLEQAIEKAKKNLTFNLETKIKIEKLDGKKDLNHIIKREEFDELNHDIYVKILKTIDDLIKETGKTIENIDHVILQGDAIRVEALTSELQKKYQDSDVIIDLYDSVACGSAIYAAQKLKILNNPQFKKFKIYDIIPLSLGIRTEGDLMSVILPKGTRIPITVVKNFITTQDEQEKMKFEIYEGERKLIKDNKLLSKTMLTKLPKKNKGQLKVEVYFQVNEEGILTVTAKNLEDDKEVTCDTPINESLTQNEILSKIKIAKDNEKEDLEEKERIQSMLKLNDKIFEYSHLYEGNEDILRKLEVYRNWIKHNSSVQKKEYEKKLLELNEDMLKDKNDSKQRRQTVTGSKKTVNSKNEEEKNPESK